MVLMLFGWLFFQLVPSKMSNMSNVNCMLLYTKCVSKQMSAWIGVKHLAVKEPHDEIYSYTYIKKWRPPHILKQGCCSSRKSPYTIRTPVKFQQFAHEDWWYWKTVQLSFWGWSLFRGLYLKLQGCIHFCFSTWLQLFLSQANRMSTANARKTQRFGDVFKKGAEDHGSDIWFS